MKKVKINNEQKEFIDNMIKEYGKETFLYYIMKPELFDELDEFTSNEVSLIFNGWYEVVDTYKVGDYVYDLPNDTYYKVTKVLDDGNVSIEPLEQYIELTFSSDQKPFTKVTEEWKVMLLNLGRKKPVLKIGDAVVVNGQFLINIDSYSKSLMYAHLVNKKVSKRFYPTGTDILLDNE